MGFREKTGEAEQRDIELLIQSELKREFSPEFINRIDDIIIFNPLTDTELRQIALLLVEDVNQALAHKGVKISVDDAAVEWLINRAKEESNSGARPLRRAIQRFIEDELSEYLIRHKDEGIEHVQFSLEDDRITISSASPGVVTNTVE